MELIHRTHQCSAWIGLEKATQGEGVVQQKKKKKRIPIFLDTVWKGVKDKHFYIMTSFHSYII
jgi:hypothetical protein